MFIIIQRSRFGVDFVDAVETRKAAEKIIRKCNNPYLSDGHCSYSIVKGRKEKNVLSFVVDGQTYRKLI